MVVKGIYGFGAHKRPMDDSAWKKDQSRKHEGRKARMKKSLMQAAEKREKDPQSLFGPD
jgi:hypothetical protein